MLSTHDRTRHAGCRPASCRLPTCIMHGDGPYVTAGRLRSGETTMAPHEGPHAKHIARDVQDSPDARGVFSLQSRRIPPPRKRQNAHIAKAHCMIHRQPKPQRYAEENGMARDPYCPRRHAVLHQVVPIRGQCPVGGSCVTLRAEPLASSRTLARRERECEGSCQRPLALQGRRALCDRLALQLLSSAHQMSWQKGTSARSNGRRESIGNLPDTRSRRP